MTSKPTPLSESVDLLLDRAAIHDLITTLFHCVDTKNFTGAAELFTADGQILLPFATYPVTELVQVSERLFAPFHATHHMVGNVAITVDGDSARSRHYVRATHVPDASDTARHADVGGWYDWLYRRTPDGWRIARYELTFVFSDGIAFEPST
ncbi:nuclear transport factor 2 family protein [Pseudonocardia alni]|uniref:nuclear transport factor 2 family protein n=1 Tax=Pseudonocardia alni TaxID=33907 RepID=UPI001AD60866|nr:nuclear transport factor 2 family protein [Pseudonocardia alni]MBO4239227.1 nuclear transport factor 2 family protein [Pseudonocardia alni]